MAEVQRYGAVPSELEDILSIPLPIRSGLAVDPALAMNGLLGRAPEEQTTTVVILVLGSQRWSALQ